MRRWWLHVGWEFPGSQSRESVTVTHTTSKIYHLRDHPDLEENGRFTKTEVQTVSHTSLKQATQT